MLGWYSQGVVSNRPRNPGPAQPSKAVTAAHRIGWGDRAARRVVFWLGLILLAGVAAYSNSFDGVFVLDDEPPLNALRMAASPFDTVRGSTRPIVDFTLAVNYALGGMNPWGYHLLNLAVHLGAAIVLFDLLRRSLLLGQRENAKIGAASIAGAVALLWVVHPLNTQAVTYVIQRAESMVVLFYLATLYALLRGATAQSKRSAITWCGVSVMCSALGMGTKQVMVTAPIAALLFDATCVAGSWREALRRRWMLHTVLAMTWVVLLALGVVAQLGLSSTSGGATSTTGDVSAGFGVVKHSWWQYLITQAAVILHYLKLVFVPWPLTFDYAWPAAKNVAQVWPELVCVSLLGLVALTLLWAKPRVGFVAVLFFLVLAPSSSFVPLLDVAFEHRMYLPTAAVLTLLVTGLASYLNESWTKQRAAAAAVVLTLVVAALGLMTHQRNADYTDAGRLWQSVLRTQPDHARAHNNLALLLASQNQCNEAIAHLTRSIEIDASSAESWFNFGTVLRQSGDRDRAAACLNIAIRLDPHHGRALGNLSLLLLDTRDWPGAEQAADAALKLDAGDPIANYAKGAAITAQRGASEESAQWYRRGLERGDYAPSLYGLGLWELSNRRLTQAELLLQKAVNMQPNSPDYLHALGIALVTQGKAIEAARAFESALRIDPSYAPARADLQKTLMLLQRRSGAGTK